MKKRVEELKQNVLVRAFMEAKTIYGKLLLAALLAAVMIACAILAPRVLGACIQKFYDYDASQSAPLQVQILPGLLLLVLLYLVQSGAAYLKMYLLNNYTSRYFTCSMRIRMADKISRLPVSYLDKTPVGDIIDRMLEDISTLGNSLHSLVDTMMIGFMQMLAVTVTMFFADWRLALVIVLIMPLSVMCSAKLSKYTGKYFESMFAENGNLYSVIEESYTNIRNTRAFNRETEREQEHAQVNERVRNADRLATFCGGLIRPAIAFMNALAYIAICTLSGVLIIRYGVPVGTAVAMIMYARQFSAPLEQIAEGMNTLRRSKAAAKRVFHFLDEPEEEPDPGHFPEKITGNVSFSHVNFSYDSERPLIEDLNLSVNAGQKIAIVGPTGAGKTTIVNLLMRFYDPQSGTISVDGTDIGTVTREDVRDLFGMVLQDTWLFRGTVAENVAYGKPEATRDEIVRACDEAYCDHFIRTLPNGYDTEIGEDSATLSGGQKQLLTVARALLADRKLLILDEATSNVDTRTEILLQKAMDRLMRGKTCFVIAHRLSTIINADLILVLRDGRIVETGTHRELLEKNGFYAEIYRSQYTIS